MGRKPFKRKEETPATASRHRKVRKIRAIPIPRDKVDIDALLSALSEMAFEQAKKIRKKKDKPG